MEEPYTIVTDDIQRGWCKEYVKAKSTIYGTTFSEEDVDKYHKDVLRLTPVRTRPK